MVRRTCATGWTASKAEAANAGGGAAGKHRGQWLEPSPGIPVTGTPPPNLADAKQPCGGTPHSLIVTGDGADDSCSDVYSFPAGGTDSDGSARIAPGGRVPADKITVGGSTWNDLKGNLVEAVIKPDNTFDYRGYGIGYSSLTNHTNQISTPRMKGASFGARCMRFRDKAVPK